MRRLDRRYRVCPLSLTDFVVWLVMMPDWARFVWLVMANPCWGPVQAVEKVDQH